MKESRILQLRRKNRAYLQHLVVVVVVVAVVVVAMVVVVVAEFEELYEDRHFHNERQQGEVNAMEGQSLNELTIHHDVVLKVEVTVHLQLMLSQSGMLWQVSSELFDVGVYELQGSVRLKTNFSLCVLSI